MRSTAIHSSLDMDLDRNSITTAASSQIQSELETIFQLIVEEVDSQKASIKPDIARKTAE